MRDKCQRLRETERERERLWRKNCATRETEFQTAAAAAAATQPVASMKVRRKNEGQANSKAPSARLPVMAFSWSPTFRRLGVPAIITTELMIWRSRSASAMLIVAWGH